MKPFFIFTALTLAALATVPASAPATASTFMPELPLLTFPTQNPTVTSRQCTGPLVTVPCVN